MAHSTIPQNPTFVLDVHLGKLARHLRMSGFDTLWRDDYPDDQLLAISRDENRILLTRDRALCERADPDRRHYVDAIEPSAQLVETLDRFGLRARALAGKGFLTRCLQCNSPVLPARGDQLADRLPGHVREEFSEFFFCPRCERVYWQGSHFARMQEWITKLLA